ncbi:hypothetical protein BSL78_22184 [Apostichopus japonicus]|uniref:Uncharacterized protein n=1 Tax=Stichopus japonicus TaxID=307972 RepID=A0A2G8JYX5_STIJA|nr:hypothetical protein BSL78_22184 [Apostichopus japonicus]
MLLLAINLILTFLPLLYFLVEGFTNIIRDWLGGVDNGPRKTMAELLRELRLQNRRGPDSVRNVLICLFDISQSTTDLAACDLARVFQTMLAAVHVSQTTRRGHVRDNSSTGLEVVVYRPHHFFHGLTLDLTVACDIARMFQSPSAALIYVDNSNLRVLNIHAELLNGNDGVQTQIVADETVIVDSEKQSCDDIFSLGECCDQQQTDVTTGLDTSYERDVEKEGSHGFLFDEDIAKLPYVEPMRPQQLVKWEELSDVTDQSFDLDQDQTTVRNVLICLFDISQSTTDLGMTLTSDKQKTGKELVPYRPPASLLNLRVDVTGELSYYV